MVKSSASGFPLLFIIFLLMSVLYAIPVQAQTTEQPVQRPGFFIAPLVEAGGYGREGLGLGGGIALGMGDGVSIGFRLLYTKALGSESVNALETTVFLRFYPFSSNVPTGFFFQIDGGTVIFAYRQAASIPSKSGSISAGISAGWRFPLGNRWYIEPVVRTGYPHIVGAGVSAGFRF